MAEKRKVIDLDEHALLRAEERGIDFGLNYIETAERIFKTVKYGRPARRKHLSKKGITYYHYAEKDFVFLASQKSAFSRFLMTLRIIFPFM